MTIDSGRGRPGPTWSHKLVSGRIPAIKRRLPEDDLRGAQTAWFSRRVGLGDYCRGMAMESGTAEPSSTLRPTPPPPKHIPQANDGVARRNKRKNTMEGVMSDVMSC